MAELERQNVELLEALKEAVVLLEDGALHGALDVLWAAIEALPTEEEAQE
jgi:hypothetical protein